MCALGRDPSYICQKSAPKTTDVAPARDAHSSRSGNSGVSSDDDDDGEDDVASTHSGTVSNKQIQSVTTITAAEQL